MTTTTTTTPTAQDTDIGKLIASVRGLEPREAHAYYGRQYQALITSAFFAPDDSFVLYPALRLLRDSKGRVTGHINGNHTTDYTPQTGNIAGSVLQSDSMNTGQASAHASAENRLFKALAETPLPPGVQAVLASYGVKADTLPRRVAHAISNAIINNAINNAVPPDYAGPLHTVRRYGTTLRRHVAASLWALDPHDARMMNQTLIAVPILGLSPITLAGAVGRKIKDVLRDLGLPVEARNLLPRALSPLAFYMFTEQRGLNGAELSWLTSGLLKALPDTTPLQYRVMLLAMRLLLAHSPEAAVTERCTWAANIADELFKDHAASAALHEWLNADPAVLTRAGIPIWHDAMSATAALDATKATTEIHKLANSATRSKPFPLPAWATTRKLPRSKWSFVPVPDEISLIGAGTRLANCAATYAGRCATGKTVIAEIRCPIPARPRGRSSLPHDAGEEIAALAEITFCWGRWSLVQIKGFANSDPLPSTTAAVQRLITEINASTENV
jgi:hypothetical protein